MTNNCRCRLSAETHSMIVVYLRRPGSFLKVLRFSAMPNIRSLAPIPCIRPVSSIFHRSAYMTFLIAGRSKSGNYIWITSMITLLTRTVSIQRVWKVLTYGLRRKNSSNQYFPTSVAEPPARKIQFANIQIYIYIGTTPRAFYIQIQSASRLSCTGNNFCRYVYISVLGCQPANRCHKVVIGIP